MAVPKKRKSHSKTRLGRSHQSIDVTRWITCPQCRELMLPHHVCQSCGYYRSRDVLQLEA